MKLPPSKGKRFYVFLFPLLTASLVRIFMFHEWQQSPLRFYHTVEGLDMKGLLDIGEVFYNGASFFNIYSVITALSYHFHGQTHDAGSIVALQLICGCITSVLITYIVLKISGSRAGAIIAGCAAALYIPELIYETQILKESIFLFSGCLGFAVLIKSSRKKFSIPWAVAAGFLGFMPALLRISGVLAGITVSLLFGIWLFRKYRKKLIGRKRFIAILLLYLAGALPPVSIFANIYFKNGLSGFSDGASYYIEKGAELSTTSLNRSSEAKKESPFIVYPSKIRDIFKAFEKSNNINYYFIRKQIGAAGYLEGPLFLLPLGICGLIVMFFKRRLLRKEGIYFAYIAAYALPILAFVPLARYRLVLLPVFCASAAYFIIYSGTEIMRGVRKRSIRKSGLLALLYILVLYWSIPENIPLRSEDFLVHGKAILASRKDTGEAERCFITAYEIAPDKRSVVLSLSGELARKGKFREAEAVLQNYLAGHDGDPKCTVNLAELYNATGRPGLAEKLIRSINVPGEPRSRTIYYYHLGVSCMLQGRKEEADGMFQKALETADKTRAEFIKNVIEHNKSNKRQ